MRASNWLTPSRSILIALGLALAAPASAKLITFDFTGSVKSMSDPGHLLDASVKTGTPFTGWYTFDGNAPGSAFGTHRMTYDMRTTDCGIEAQVGRYRIRSTGPEPNMDVIVGDDDNSPPQDTYTVSSNGNLSSDPNVNFQILNVALTDNAHTAISSTALPLSPSDLDGFPFRLGYLAFERPGGGDLGTIRAKLDSLTVRETTPVPEPGSISLLALTAVPLSALRVRRRLRTSRQDTPAQPLYGCCSASGFEGIAQAR